MDGEGSSLTRQSNYHPRRQQHRRIPGTSASALSSSSETSPLELGRRHQHYHHQQQQQSAMQNRGNGESNYATFQSQTTASSSLKESSDNLPRQQNASYSTASSSSMAESLESPSASSLALSFTSSFVIPSCCRESDEQIPTRSPSPSSPRSSSPSRPSFVSNHGSNTYTPKRSAAKTPVFTCKALSVLSVAFAFLVYMSCRPDSSIAPEWHWDHNIYIPRSYDATSYNNTNMDDNNKSNSTKPTTTALFPSHGRTSLLAQTASSWPLEELSDITSRPNRAYARGWGMDYAQYDSGASPNNPKACFDKVYVLNTILDKQQPRDEDYDTTNKDVSSSPQTAQPQSLWPRPAQLPPPHVQYDSMIVLPSDSVITDLDKNIFEFMLPPDKLVAIAGSHERGTVDSKSDVILFNLKHEYTMAVAKRWSELVLPNDVTCGANNDLALLISAVLSVIDTQKGEQIEDFVHLLEETDDGFVGNTRLIKCIPPSVPGQRSLLMFNNLQESSTKLQETANAVCYRFYPKCEVL